MITIEKGTYAVEFRCKRCNAIFNTGMTIHLKGQAFELTEGESEKLRKKDLMIHECSPYKYGLGEICGFTLQDA